LVFELWHLKFTILYEIHADFHIHSKYSRATSKDMEVETLAQWAKKKGIAPRDGRLYPSHLFCGVKGEVGTLWEMASQVEEGGSRDPLHFDDRGEQYVHPGWKREKNPHAHFCSEFRSSRGHSFQAGNLGKLSSDGRPIFSFTAKELVKMILDISPDCLTIPAHAWTPWFSILEQIQDSIR
jgi:hypothetical protein